MGYLIASSRQISISMKQGTLSDSHVVSLLDVGFLSFVRLENMDIWIRTMSCVIASSRQISISMKEGKISDSRYSSKLSRHHFIHFCHQFRLFKSVAVYQE